MYCIIIEIRSSQKVLDIIIRGALAEVLKMLCGRPIALWTKVVYCCMLWINTIDD